MKQLFDLIEDNLNITQKLSTAYETCLVLVGVWVMMLPVSFNYCSTAVAIICTIFTALFIALAFYLEYKIDVARDTIRETIDLLEYKLMYDKKNNK